MMFKNFNKKVLIIGIGNDARGDDGLGWAFVQKLSLPKQHFNLEYRYQLQVEDAELISNYDLVIFVDACHDTLPNGFAFEPCQAIAGFEFSTHAVKPEAILALCKDLYDSSPQTYIFKIQGYQWELGSQLSDLATINLNSALIEWKNATSS